MSFSLGAVCSSVHRRFILSQIDMTRSGVLLLFCGVGDHSERWALPVATFNMHSFTELFDNCRLSLLSVVMHSWNYDWGSKAWSYFIPSGSVKWASKWRCNEIKYRAWIHVCGSINYSETYKYELVFFGVLDCSSLYFFNSICCFEINKRYRRK